MKWFWSCSLPKTSFAAAGNKTHTWLYQKTSRLKISGRTHLIFLDDLNYILFISPFEQNFIFAQNWPPVWLKKPDKDFSLFFIVTSSRPRTSPSPVILHFLMTCIISGKPVFSSGIISSLKKNPTRCPLYLTSDPFILKYTLSFLLHRHRSCYHYIWNDITCPSLIRHRNPLL